MKPWSFNSCMFRRSEVRGMPYLVAVCSVNSQKSFLFASAHIARYKDRAPRDNAWYFLDCRSETPTCIKYGSLLSDRADNQNRRFLKFRVVGLLIHYRSPLPL